jgi:hypothetical protein
MVLCDENRRFSKRVRKSYFVLFYESRTDRLQLLVSRSRAQISY